MCFGRLWRARWAASSFYGMLSSANPLQALAPCLMGRHESGIDLLRHSVRTVYFSKWQTVPLISSAVFICGSISQASDIWPPWIFHTVMHLFKRVLAHCHQTSLLPSALQTYCIKARQSFHPYETLRKDSDLWKDHSQSQEEGDIFHNQLRYLQIKTDPVAALSCLLLTKCR